MEDDGVLVLGLKNKFRISGHVEWSLRIELNIFLINE